MVIYSNEKNGLQQIQIESCPTNQKTEGEEEEEEEEDDDEEDKLPLATR